MPIGSGIGPSSAQTYSHPFSLAFLAASARFPAPTLLIASERELRTVPSESPSRAAMAAMLAR